MSGSTIGDGESQSGGSGPITGGSDHGDPNQPAGAGPVATGGPGATGLPGNGNGGGEGPGR